MHVADLPSRRRLRSATSNQLDVRPSRLVTVGDRSLWAPAQRKRATMLYFANVFFIYFFMAALFSGPG